MSVDQPEASTSTSSPSPPHLATVVFDQRLPRERYVKLIEADGILHRLVQRLMDKHRGETNLRIAVLITTSGSPPATTFQQDFHRPSHFLTSLPRLAARFALSGAASRAERKWPFFSDVTGLTIDEGGIQAKGRKRKRESDASGGVLNGVVGGLELLARPPLHNQLSPAYQTLISLTPASAEPLLSSLFGLSPPSSPVPTLSPRQKYLLVVAQDADDVDGSEAERESTIMSNWDAARDGLGWNELVEQCRGKGVKCSCVITEIRDRVPEPDGSIGKRLRTLCEEASIGLLDDVWFDIPPDVEVHLSGYSIDEGTLPPSPSLVQASTVGTDLLITPSSTTIDDPIVNGQSIAQRQQIAHNTALRILQGQMARGLGNATGTNPSQVSPAVLQSLMVATKNGNVDLNNPALQQFKNLVMLQQQQKLGQVANPTMDSLPGNNPLVMPSSTGTEQMAQAVPNQQKHQQSLPSSVPTNQVPMPPNTNRPAKLWSGDVAWVMNNANGQNTLRISVDTFPFSPNSPQDVQLQLWPTELRIGNAIQINVTELQNYAKANRTPCVVFVPRAPNVETANATRYHQFVNILNTKGTMAIVPFGQPDRGIVLFARPMNSTGVDGQRVLRLMGVVCLTVPIPSINRSAPSQPIASQSHLVQSQQQIQPVPLNGMQSYQPMPPVQQVGMPPAQMGTKYMYRLQEQNFQQQQQQQEMASAPQSQPPFQQMQQLQQPQIQAEPGQPSVPTRINSQGVDRIMEAARRSKINIPPGFDPTSIPPEQLGNILRVIQAEEARQRVLQLQQQQQQQQFQEAQQPNQQAMMGEMFPQQMRPGQGQFMQ